jgi:hypothetical protein
MSKAAAQSDQGQHGGPSRRLYRALRNIDPAIVRRMEGRLECRKPDHVMERLGISLNTWDKLLLGEAIRESTALRLLDRFGHG